MTKVRIKTNVPKVKRALVEIKRRGPSMVIKVTIQEGSKPKSTVVVELKD